MSVRALLIVFCFASGVSAEPPDTAYIFPAGGQRGQTVTVRVGGYYLHEGAAFRVFGTGVTASNRIEQTEKIWFEGPVIPLPDSQRKEDYPQDYLGTISIAEDAPPGIITWRAEGSQGLTPVRKFVIGDLPEIVEQEIEGTPIPVKVEFPVTINGRIFPREDVDIWTFEARQGQRLTCNVVAAAIGSPLDSRLELLGPDGRRIAENDDATGKDSRLQFTAPTDGVYSLRIHDANFNGLQDHVYRLTITDGPWINACYPLGGQQGQPVTLELTGLNLDTNPIVVNLPGDASSSYEYRTAVNGLRSNPISLDLDKFTEYLEETKPATPIEVPAVLNGRIRTPGEQDEWTFSAAKGTSLSCEVWASRLGSPLDSTLAIFNSAGKQLAANDDIGNGQTDSQLSFTVPEDGLYTVKASDTLASRGGDQFAYRLKIHTADEPNSQPEFAIEFPADIINLERGTSAKIKLNVERKAGLQAPIELLFENLPKGVTLNGQTIAAKKNNTQLELIAAEDAELVVTDLKIRAQALHEIKEKVDGKEKVVETLEIIHAVVPQSTDRQQQTVTLAVTVATPFKFSGVFESKYAPRGSVHVRPYQLDRGGFEGPIEISLADKQVRHLQGVTGPTIIVPPGATEFEYPVTLPPWLEVGRTSRTTLMAVGIVKDTQGNSHKVTYTSDAQNDQIIVLTDPARLSIESTKSSIAARPGGSIEVPITIGRGPGLTGPVTVSLDVPRHLHGIEAEAIVIPAGSQTGTLTIHFNQGPLGPFNSPVLLHAKMNDERGYPVVNEFAVEVVEGR